MRRYRPAAATVGAGLIEDQAGAVREFRPAGGRQRHHWDPRNASFPGTFTGESIHSHYYVDPSRRWRSAVSASWCRDRQQRRRHHRRAVVEDAAEQGHPVHPLQRRIVPRNILPTTRDKIFKTTPYLPLAWQRKAAQAFAPLVGADPTKYGLPPANHKLSRRIPPSRWSCHCGSAPVTSSRNPTSGLLDGSTVHFEDGTSDEFDVIIYATGYNITFRSSTPT
jgi:hypothetical protein